MGSILVPVRDFPYYNHPHSNILRRQAASAKLIAIVHSVKPLSSVINQIESNREASALHSMDPGKPCLCVHSERPTREIVLLAKTEPGQDCELSIMSAQHNSGLCPMLAAKSKQHVQAVHIIERKLTGKQ